MDTVSLNYVDYGIVAIMLFSVVVSVMRGFVRESLSIVSWIVAIWLALKFSKHLAGFLTGYIAQPQLRLAAAFLLLFLIALIIGTLISYIVSTIMMKTGLSGTDRVLGMVFGFARGALLIGLMVMVVHMTDIGKQKAWSDASLVKHFVPIADWLHGFIPEQAKQHLKGKK